MTTGKRRVRPVFLAALLLALVLVVGLGVRAFMRRRAYTAAQEQRLRTMALVEVAPSPLPAALPIVGSTTPGADGYALAHVDKPALRSLFWHRKYAELTRDFEQFQDAFEADTRTEYWPLDAGDAFESAEPALDAKLNEWVAAAPDSFAPHLARGIHELAVAWAKRGDKWAKDTPKEDFDAMMLPLRKARTDLSRALALRPKLVAAMRALIKVSSAAGEEAEKTALVDRATSACPACFQVRVTYLLSTTPRWGGTYAAMDAFARTAPLAQNPRFRLLEGYADVDRASIARHDDDLGAASLAIERAMRLGDHWEFFLERGRIRQARKDQTGALADFERAAELRPGVPNVEFARAWTLNVLHRNEEAARALLDGLRVEATDATARELFPYVIANLDWEGWEAHKQGKRDEALRKYDLAVELAPTQHDLIQRRAWIIVGGESPDIAALQAAVKANPDDLRLHQQLDYSLAQKRRFSEVITLWTDYIARHPDDATAYRERGGAYYNMRDMPRARADASKACELGDNEGCLHARL